MSHCLRFALALSTIVSAIALAADDDPVQAPDVRVGDCWSYRGDNLDNRGRIDDYEECVTFVDRNKDVILAVAKIKSDGREIETGYSSDWFPSATIDGQIVTPVKGQKLHLFPLHIGDTRSFEVEFRRALLGANAGKVAWNYKVVGWEDITVPAGRFHAIKIEGRGDMHRYDVFMNVPLKSAWWYAPEVNRHVKAWLENPDGRRGVEMTGYRLNK